MKMVYSNQQIIKKFPNIKFDFNIQNYCYLVGFRNGILFANNNKENMNCFGFFSLAIDTCPCLLNEASYQSFKIGFVGGYST
jgi:hypothetical protein